MNLRVSRKRARRVSSLP
jgi:hypothetical protein